MRLGNFAVEVTPGRELGSGYVAMSHNTKYAIQLTNFGSLQCDAEVKVDGKHVGTWRVPAEKSIVLERPVHDTGRFTFYRFGTPEAEKVGLTRCPELGLISVLFKPESLRRYSIAPGGTGLSGRSEQQFREVLPLNYDETAFVQIHLRLGCDDEEPRPLNPISTPVPPPLDMILDPSRAAFIKAIMLHAYTGFYNGMIQIFKEYKSIRFDVNEIAAFGSFVCTMAFCENYHDGKNIENKKFIDDFLSDIFDKIPKRNISKIPLLGTFIKNEAKKEFDIFINDRWEGYYKVFKELCELKENPELYSGRNPIAIIYLFIKNSSGNTYTQIPDGVAALEMYEEFYSTLVSLSKAIREI